MRLQLDRQLVTSERPENAHHLAVHPQRPAHPQIPNALADFALEHAPVNVTIGEDIFQGRYRVETDEQSGADRFLGLRAGLAKCCHKCVAMRLRCNDEHWKPGCYVLAYEKYDVIHQQ